MKKTRISRIALVILLSLVMLLQLAPLALAGQVNFPLMALNGIDRVADANTLYLTTIVQDPATKFITATVTVTNGSTGAGAQPIKISGVGVQLSFSDKIAPYRYNPLTDGNNHPYDASRMYTNTGPSTNLDVFKRYCYAPTDGFDTIGSSTVQNNADGRFIGAKISTVEDAKTITLAPGATATIAHLYFMPLNGTDNLTLDMFKYDWSVNMNAMIRLSTWIANGTRFVVADSRYPSSVADYVVSPASFKLHVKPATPVVSANNDTRTITGYNNATMEWAYAAAGPYTAGAPVVLDTDHTIYVRVAATAYSAETGSFSTNYGLYKRYLASDVASVVFGRNFYSCENDVSVKKTGVNITTPAHADGRTHVGDTLRYTIIAKNDGHINSVWANATMVDTMPAGVTFAGNVTLNGVNLVLGTGYTFTGGVLTVPLGNIPGGTQKTVTFTVTVNSSAYGTTVLNSVTVNGRDGEGGDPLNKGANDDGNDNNIVARSAAPTVNPITEGDATISGTGVPGAQIVVTLPDGTELPVTVPAGGNWSVNVPVGKRPVSGDTIGVVQNEPNKDPSAPVNTVVGGRPAHVEQTSKTSVNLDRISGRRVGDKLRYTITVTNAGPAKSLWANVIIVDTLPTEVDFVTGSVRINGAAATASQFSYSAGVLTVNLGDIAGGVTMTVSFEAIINETAYGKTFVNTAVVDGKNVPEGPGTPPPVTDRTATPTVDEVNEGDRAITGTGVPGATVVVSYPGSTQTSTATVGTDGKWTANVPTAVNLVEGQVVSAVQTATGLGASEPQTATVQGKKEVVPYLKKTSENKTSTDGFTRAGDKILFTITVRNDGSPKSVWSNVVVSDSIPDGLTYVPGSVLLDNTVPTYSSFVNPLLKVNVTVPIRGGETHIVTFEATVNADAYGKTILNSASVLGKDGNGNDVGDETDDDGGGFTIIGKTDSPTVDPITRGDNTIRGKGKPGAEVKVVLPDGTELTGTVDTNGDWSVNVPAGKEPDTGDTITVTQKEPGKGPSDPVVITVADKNYRGIKGYVWPMVDNDLTLGSSFLRKHDIVVELRATFMTPAAAGLSTTTTLVTTGSYKGGTGEFTFERVPFGTYVLVIKRPGYLVRAMMVTFSASDPDMRIIAPPGTDDNGVFNLWWGDCNGDFRIDNEDIMMIMELMNIYVNAHHAQYRAECDLNADGLIDNEDIVMVLERWDRIVTMYPGGESINYFI